MLSDKAGKTVFIRGFIKNKRFQRFAIALLTIIISFFILQNGAKPEKYSIEVNDVSNYNIVAPRDIENEYLTEKNALEASGKVLPAFNEVDSELILEDYNIFFESIYKSREENKKFFEKYSEEDNYKELYEEYFNKILDNLNVDLNKFDFNLSSDEATLLISLDILSDEELEDFEIYIINLVDESLKEEITIENIDDKKSELIDEVKKGNETVEELDQIAKLLINNLLTPNMLLDSEETDEMKKSVYDEIMESNKVIVSTGEKIIEKGDVVTEDKYEMLKELDLIESNTYDYKFSLSIVFILIFLLCILIIYSNLFYEEIFMKMNYLLLLSVIVIFALFIARVTIYLGFSPLVIPIFIVPMLLTLLINVKIAVIVNVLLAVCITLITDGDVGFLFMALTSGTLASFIVDKSDNRSKLSIGGVAISCINVLLIVSLGIINKTYNDLISNSIAVFTNGIISAIFTIGTLQIWEGLFGILTSLKLLELGNPNHPLIRKLLMEAPGTYHHSLLVANLAEVAAEDIGGDSLLARVGAYYHDVGKIKRPNFFKENQYSENPHDKMTANLSTLVITSHTSDGLELAKKYKLPQEIRDIIIEHHGTTLVAFFYVKAKNKDKEGLVREEDFRYVGPRPKTKESAVVMLADSVEASVRSMPDKTEGKIEGLVRKIIKGKLDDGQLDHSELTLKDLDSIARSFMKVLSGYFHQRTEYPRLEKPKEKQKINIKKNRNIV